MVQVFPFQLSISVWAAFGKYQPTATLNPTPVGREIIRAMPALDPIEIRRLSAPELPAHLDDLAAVLADCVAGGASVSYMAPFTHDQAREAFQAMAAEVDRGRRLLLAAFAGDRLVGTVQVILAVPPNQPHRAEIAKLLVHRDARNRGVARLLMERADAEARAEGKTLLVLDTVTGGTADRLYTRLGWTRVGEIPGYALYPDGRPCGSTIFWKAP
jgi:GNAT superfamily N-acetyltransferase